MRKNHDISQNERNPAKGSSEPPLRRSFCPNKTPSRLSDSSQAVSVGWGMQKTGVTFGGYVARLDLGTVQDQVAELGGKDVYSREFIFDLLAAYGRSKSSITRLRSGSLNVSDHPDVEVAQKNIVYFKPTTDDLYVVIDSLADSPTVVKFNTRFLIVTDYEHLLAIDRVTNETLDIPLSRIDEHFDFFLPWAGMEKSHYVAEAHADIKAAERMGKLFDELVKVNKDQDISRDSLNLFFTRLLFCFFAEDTGIFEPGLFTSKIESLTQEDGSDLQPFLTDVFLALDTKEADKRPTHLRQFPYVNGQLFTIGNEIVPTFNRTARSLLLRSGHLRWDEINPDIFGSMFQAVVDPKLRSDLGQHYTSVPNILKTIKPLFLDDLWEEFTANQHNPKKLEALRKRISQIKVFDPACGSGNFLIIAYKELRRLENAILEALDTGTLQTEVLGSLIPITNFYGIEIDPLAREVAILALWIAKHQMNVEFKERFGIDIPLIPLRDAGNIVTGNAARLNWNTICPNNGTDEIYLIGNPPYLGSSRQTKEQKEDYVFAFSGFKFSKNLDYISIWFYKGAQYIAGSRAQLAFVTTNSVAQGQHVALIFPPIFEMRVEIGFAYTSFKWTNNARRNAGVTVAVISLRPVSTTDKYIYTDDIRNRVQNISPYLADGPTMMVRGQRKPLSDLPAMTKGSQPTDAGNLLLDLSERLALLGHAPEAAKYIREVTGSQEYINGLDRWCIWVEPEDAAEARLIPELKNRFDAVASSRSNSDKAATKALSKMPWRFAEVRHKHTEAIIVPRVSSERRVYVPFGYVGPSTVVSDGANAVYDAQPWVFALLTSKMHMVWLRAVGGKMKTDYRYSNTLVYNTFPVPDLSAVDKEVLTQRALRVLDVREYHSEKTLAELYDPDLMPDNLRLAHQELDEAVDRLYRRRGFASDEERLALLFKLYQEMTSVKGPLR